MVHCWYSIGRPVTIGTPMVLTVFDDWHSVPFVKTAKMTIGTPMVLTVFDDWYSVPFVKTAKMTIGVPIANGF